MAIAAFVAISAGTLYAGSANADTVASANTTTSTHTRGSGKGHGVGGTVTAINSTSITLTGSNNTTYTVDASNAKFLKIGSGGTTAPTTITIADINVGDTIMVRGTFSGTTVTATQILDGKLPTRVKPAANGTVSAVNGNTITLTSKNGTTYSVDATNAKILKASGQTTTGTSTTRPTPTTITVANIQVGDTLAVQGTVSGTSVTATSIFDGKFAGRGTGSKGTHVAQGPHVAGTVTAITGNAITVNDAHGAKGSTAPVTYSVDATNAKITKSAGKGATPTTISVSDIQVGDMIMVRGTVSGTSVTATSIMDGILIGGHQGIKTVSPVVAQ